MKYKWAEGTRVEGLDAQEVGEELERIKQKYGQLTTKVVLKEAKKKSSQLHDYFEWNDTTAAEHYRLVQAGYIIRHVTVVFEDDLEQEKQVRAFVSVKQGNDKKMSFVSIKTAMQHPDLRKQVFANALHEIVVWQKKYKYLTVFGRIFEEIEAIKVLVAPKTKKKPVKITVISE